MMRVEEKGDAAAMHSYHSARPVQDFAIVCLVCRHRFGNRRSLAHPTSAKMHRLICPSCIKNKALRKLYRDPEYKAAIMAMWEREKKKKKEGTGAVAGNSLAFIPAGLYTTTAIA
ncbi:hypothetical protein [Nitrososphaera viennensis]|nr:hypothetical protein [Nitrososphaera viennensis]UVS68137.1 hypothetical protein NWT39_09525 [Nitrososphaera viennensis]